MRCPALGDYGRIVFRVAQHGSFHAPKDEIAPELVDVRLSAQDCFVNPFGAFG
jgi:hypothetical protein